MRCKEEAWDIVSRTRCNTRFLDPIRIDDLTRILSNLHSRAYDIFAYMNKHFKRDFEWKYYGKYVEEKMSRVFFLFLNHDFEAKKRGRKRANVMWLQRLWSNNRERKRKRWRIFLAEGGNESSSPLDPYIRMYRSLIRRLFSTHFPISPSWSVFHVRELLALTKSQYEISASERCFKVCFFFRRIDCSYLW